MRNDSDNTFRIAFTYERNGESYYSDSTVDICPGDTELDTIGDQFNAFLSQIGYVRENPCMFLEDVTDDELEALEQFLIDYRQGYYEARFCRHGQVGDDILQRIKSGNGLPPINQCNGCRTTGLYIPEPRIGK